MSDLNEKRKWFNSLPMKRIDPFNWQRECPCGATVWYEAETQDLCSWMDIHFNHQNKRPEPKAFEYDFTRPIRFSKPGFELFKQERNLEYCPNPADLDRDYFIGNNDIFAFYPDYKTVPMRDEYENLFVTFDPYCSSLNVR